MSDKSGRHGPACPGGAAAPVGTERAMPVLELLGRIAQERTVDAVWHLSAAYFRSLGFARVSYGLTRYRTEKSMGDPDDALYLTTNDAAYREFYFRDGFYTRTPVWRWITHNTGATTWRWVEDDLKAGRLSPQEETAVRQNAAWGVVAGIAISFPETTQRTKGALGLTADLGLDHDAVDKIWDREGPAIMAVGNMMHLKLVSLPARMPRRKLTPRQREVLEWVADGKTMQDIATVLGLSTAMVEKHLRLAREALDVDTTAQAVAKGTLLNLFYSRENEAEARAN